MEARHAAVPHSGILVFGLLLAPSSGGLTTSGANVMEADMRPTNQGYRMLLAVLICVAAVAGCATFRNTLAQDQALERWQMCQGKAPDVTLKEVRPDGQI